MRIRSADVWSRLRAVLSKQKVAPRERITAVVFAWVSLGAGLLVLLAPMLADFSTFGFHDWDVETAYRYITVLSLKQYGEGPWWHPWLCGGFPAFGHVEGATNLVSPYLPLYLLADLRTAIRLEVVGAGLTGLCGAYLLAGRFTRSVALRALVAAVFVFNGRWALQAAVGHTWHLQYGWLPWAWYFFDRALESGKRHNALYAGAVVALMAYLGGIYPLPHTALLLSGYAGLLAIAERRIEPVLALAITGVTAVGLSAPKLFAIIDTMGRAPRLIESNEVIGLAELLVMLTDPDQRYGSWPVQVPAYGWHEWGIYVGVGGLACLVVALLFARGARGQVLKLLGVGFLLLGFGKFHPYAPWTLLHELPGFASQHVPSRFHYSMLLVLMLAFVTVATPRVERWQARWRFTELVLLVPIVVMVVDLCRVNHQPFAQAFWMEKPEVIEPAPVFEHRTRSPVHYERRDWAAPMLLAMMANTGVIDCYGIDPDFEGIGAIAADAEHYRGLVHLESGAGRAELLDWSPNRARVRVSDAEPGALLVYNMNYDPSWRAAGEPAIPYGHRVATRVRAPDQIIEFRYFPRSFKLSVPLFLLTAVTCLLALRRVRTQRSAAKGKHPK